MFSSSNLQNSASLSEFLTVNIIYIDIYSLTRNFFNENSFHACSFTDH